MTRRVDQVDQEVGAVGLLALDVLEILLVRESGVQRDGGRLDGNTTCDKSVHTRLPRVHRGCGRSSRHTLLLVSTSVGGTGITSLSGGDDTSLGQQGVGQGRFAVVDMGNNTHVSHIGGLLHETMDLVDREAGKRSPRLAKNDGLGKDLYVNGAILT